MRGRGHRRALPLVPLLLLLTAPAGAEGRAPDSGGGWLDVHGGLTVATQMLSAIQTEGVEPTPTPTFGIGAYWRTRRVDLGVLVGHIAGTWYVDEAEVRRLHGSTRAAAILRWRFVHGSWGALYMRLSPGWGGFRFTEDLRETAAPASGSEATELRQGASGFSLGLATGLAIHFSRRHLAYLELESVNGFTTIEGGEERVPVSLSHTLLTAGVQWRL